MSVGTVAYYSECLVVKKNRPEMASLAGQDVLLLSVVVSPSVRSRCISFRRAMILALEMNIPFEASMDCGAVLLACSSFVAPSFILVSISIFSCSRSMAGFYEGFMCGFGRCYGNWREQGTAACSYARNVYLSPSIDHRNLPANLSFPHKFTLSLPPLSSDLVATFFIPFVCVPATAWVSWDCRGAQCSPCRSARSWRVYAWLPRPRSRLQGHCFFSLEQ